MEQYTILQYQDSLKEVWDDFVKNAKNATFLFQRDFMDYHSDRFQDYSLMVFYKEKPIAVLPANINNQIIHSHQGLSYGGLVLAKTITFEQTVNAFQLVLKHLADQGLETLNLKLLPSIYNGLPSDEMEYLLFILEAKLTRRDISSTIFYDEQLKIESSNRLRGIKRGEKNELEVRQETDFERYWDEVLAPNLKEVHNRKPVHTKEEIALLQSKFPNNIKQFNVYKGNEVVAGTTVFETPFVAHAQYISANETGRNVGALDFLFNYLIDYFTHKRYFDFGISNEEQGLKVNKGLLHWKESFGGRSVVHEFYEVKTSNHHLLNTLYL